ncbi:MAG: alginate lyase family protein [Limnochordia bacterium]|jgi:hypothetical protein
MSKFRSAILFLLVGLLMVGTGIAYGNNVINNPSFDSDLQGWGVWKPRGSPDVTIDNEEWHSSPGSLRITGFTATDRGSANQRVTVEGGTTYVFRVWMKTQDVSRQVAYVRIQFNDADNPSQKTRQHLYVGRLSGTNDWALLEESFLVPEGTGTLTIEPFLDSAQGTVWFDDLELIPAESEPLTLVDPSVRILTSGAVVLNWKIPTAYEQANVRYRIYRSPMPDFSVSGRAPVAVIDQPEFIDRDTKSDQTNYYRIQPFYVKQGKEQLGDLSPALEARITSATTVTSPRAFFADWEAGQARLTWDLGSSRARQVRLERKGPDTDDQWRLLAIAPAWQSEYIDTNLPDDAREKVTYSITVLGPDWEETTRMTAHVEGFLPTLPRPVSIEEHPRLFITKQEIDRLNEAAQTNPAYRLLINNEIITPARMAAVAVNTSGVTLPGKNENSAHSSLARQARSAALGYAFTGDLSQAEAAKKILMAYAASYKEYPLLNNYDGHVTYQTLNESPWLIDIAWAYDLIWNSGLLSAEDRQAIEDDLLWEGVRVIDRYDKGLSNWQAWHNAGIGAVAFLLNDQKWIDEILTGSQSFVVHIRDGIRDDGIWWEQAIGYHNYTRSALTFLAEMAYRHGYDLYSFRSRGKSLKLMFDGPIHHAFADGMHPVVGNTSFTSRLSFDWTYGLGALRYGDPRYAALWKASMSGGGSIPSLFYMQALNELDTGTISHGTGRFAPAGFEMAGSTHLADTGMVVLRGGDLDAALLYKPHGTTIGHQAADNLTIMLESRSGRWLPGTGSFDYNRDEQGTWYKQTVARNGVVVDERSQYPQGVDTAIFASDSGRSSAGSLLHFVALPSASIAVAATDNVYPGVSMERTVLLSAPYVIDRYRVESDERHQYDWVAHFDARPGLISVEQQGREKALGSRAGYQHITGVEGAETADTWYGVWEKNDDKLRLSMLGGEDTEVLRAYGYGSGLSPRPLVMARRHGTSTEFIAVMECYRQEPSVFSVESFRPENGSDGLRLLRQVSEDLIVTDELVWSTQDETGDEPIELEKGRRALGRLAFFRSGTDGETESLLLLDGTLAQTAELRVTSALPADLVVEKLPLGGYAVAHNSEAVRTLTVHGDESASWRLFEWSNDALAPYEEAYTREADGISWQAEPGVIYLLSSDEPAPECLARFIVKIQP